MATRMAKEFEKLLKKLEKLNSDVLEESKKALMVEAQKVIRDAKKLTPVNTGLLRNGWYADKPIERIGTIELTVGNSLDYASFVERGFRAHFVPGQWQGNIFKYDPNFKGGMFVGGKKNRFVPGHYMLEKATAPSDKRIYQYLNKRIAELGRDLGD